MSTNALPAEPEWLVRSRKAAHCARRRLKGAALTTQDLEDTIQAAALAYWKHQQEGRSKPFCFVCACQGAEKHFHRNILGRNPRSFLSLDTPTHDDGDLPREWLPALDSGDEANYHLAWLSHEALERVLVDARLTAGYSNVTCCAAL